MAGSREPVLPRHQNQKCGIIFKDTPEVIISRLYGLPLEGQL
jgi:hypothetical protein